MLKFSASKGEQGSKVYYKNYQPVSCTMATLGRYLKGYSVSSFMYGDGVTPKGEQVEGRRAHEEIIDAGNLLLIDIDSKYVPVTFDELAERLEGVSAYLAPSKSWSEEVQKYHIAVEMVDPLPTDKDDFRAVYRAVCQYLGLDGLYDPAMQTPTQQLAPHFRDDAPEQMFSGAAVDAGVALSAYVPPEGEEGAGGRGIAGTVPAETVFTLSNGGRELGVEDMLAHVQRHGKERVHCAAGLEHDGRKDTAFVQPLDDGRAIYFCSGGRCQKTLVMESNPFELEAEEMEIETVEVKTGGSIWDDVAGVRARLEAHPVMSLVYAEGATATLREEAVSFAGQQILEDRGIARVNEEFMEFDGRQWSPFFTDAADFHRFVSELFVAAGFVSMAYSHSRTENVARFLKKQVGEAKREFTGNYLNMRNCVLEVSKHGVKTHSHDKGFLFTSTLPYDYSPTASAPVWSSMVNKIMCERPSLVESFKQALGYLLLQDTNFEKMVCFVGEGSNGKTTVMDVIKWMVGKTGYSSTPIKMLLKDNSEGLYSRTTLAGKLVNITNELTPDSLEADAFKDLITGEDIQARHAFGRPFNMDRVPKQLVAMNTTDRLVKERTHGYMRRLHLIPFDYTIQAEDYDPLLKDKLRGELAGILNWCLAGAQAVISSNGLATSDEMDTLLDDVARDANPVQQFLEEHVELYQREYTPEDHGLLTRGEDLLSEYREFCAENGYKPMGRNKFFAEVHRLGVHYVNSAARIDGRLMRVRGFFCVLSDQPFTAQGENVVAFKRKNA